VRFRSTLTQGPGLRCSGPCPQILTSLFPASLPKLWPPESLLLLPDGSDTPSFEPVSHPHDRQFFSVRLRYETRNLSTVLIQPITDLGTGSDPPSFSSADTRTHSTLASPPLSRVPPLIMSFRRIDRGVPSRRLACPDVHHRLAVASYSSCPYFSIDQQGRTKFEKSGQSIIECSFALVCQAA